MAAIRKRLTQAERRYRAKDGTELTFFGLLASGPALRRAGEGVKG